MSDLRLTGYGPSNQWRQKEMQIMGTKELSYLKLKELKDVFGFDGMSTDKNELALAIALALLVQYLDERSLLLVMRVARNNIREAVRIHRAQYAGSSKPSIITLYNHLTTLTKNHSESITDYIISAENISTVLNAADKKSL